MKVAIVHDWLTTMGGAENVIIEIRKIFPDAPIYTSVYNPEKLAPELQNIDVRTSFLQHKKGALKNHTKYFPLMPIAFESFDLNEYDLVISSSTSCAHGVITNPDTLHICYCNTPMRYGWEFYYDYIKNMGKIKKKMIPFFMNYMRIWDKVSADRADYFLANSQNVAHRIKKHYRREAEVLYPPVYTNDFIQLEKKDFYLVLSRLVEYKRIDLAIEAFNELRLPLFIIGSGPEEKKLKKIAQPNIMFLGRLSNDEVKKYYAEAKGFIFPGEEDFGITPVESQASGTPVIAYGKGGALETIIEDKTGVFFYNQTKESLINAVNSFEKKTFNREDLLENAKRFDQSVFSFKLTEIIKRLKKHEDSDD